MVNARRVVLRRCMAKLLLVLLETLKSGDVHADLALVKENTALAGIQHTILIGR